MSEKAKGKQRNLEKLNFMEIYGEKERERSLEYPWV